jgi:hypothetical protein
LTGEKTGYLTEQEVAAIQTLHRDVPYAIEGISRGMFSIARHSGGMTYQGFRYVYVPKHDECVRADVHMRVEKMRKKAAQAEKRKTKEADSCRQGSLNIGLFVPDTESRGSATIETVQEAAINQVEAKAGRPVANLDKALSYRQRELLNNATTEWGNVPVGLGCTNQALEALERRGPVERRYSIKGGCVVDGHQQLGWQWRKTPT